MIKRNIYIYIVLFFFLINSCMVTKTESIRKKIIKDNPDVTDVGIILDWTNSDHKYIALELILKGGHIIFLTSVNYRKLPDREPFKLSKVNNYAFAKIRHYVDKRTNESKIEIRTNQRYSISELSTKIDIRINSMRDIINNYFYINAFVETLPTVNEENYQKLIEEEKLVIDTIEETEHYFVTTYSVKTIWDDKYYGKEMREGRNRLRKPDYDNNELTGGLYFWGI